MTNPTTIARSLGEAQRAAGDLDAAFSAILTKRWIEIDAHEAKMLQTHRLRAAQAFAAVRAAILAEQEGRDAAS